MTFSILWLTIIHSADMRLAAHMKRIYQGARIPRGAENVLV